ncbi:MAG: glycosyltransferase family 4 protein [Candidatus Pacebacteria bacterium]|nr:glycosyltransferase family 4 protein [Candidatus Paceibacterota bacterium]
MKLKVLFIITKSGWGGAQKNVTDLANNLDKSLFETKVSFGGIGAENDKIKHLSNNSGFLFSNDILAIFELIKIYKKERPNIVHLNSSKAGVLGAIAAKIYGKTKVVFTAHGWVFNPDNAIIAPIRWFYILLHKIAALFQDKIICVSGCDYQLALKYKIAPAEKLTMIHNGINNFNLETRENSRLFIKKDAGRKNKNININLPFIGSIGRLTKEKNYEALIKTASLIPTANFIIIGDGQKRVKLSNLIKKLNLKNTFIVDPIGNDAMFLKAFDIFVLPSIKEGLPYILLEAMAAGLPTIVTNAGGMPEVVKNEENGLIVPQKNPGMLADAINRLLTNPKLAEEFGAKAQKNIRENFSLEKMVKETEGVYKLL